jgi:hypothetical protein
MHVHDPGTIIESHVYAHLLVDKSSTATRCIYSSTAKCLGSSMLNSCCIHGCIGVSLLVLIHQARAAQFCERACENYFAGASTNSPIICQYQASGAGSDVQNEQQGVACYPAYGCADDWTVCVQQGAPSASEATSSPTAEEVCTEIAGLEMGPGPDGQEVHKPPGGWQPTPKAGWMKMAGSIRCGWGGGYGSISPDGSSHPIREFGGVTYTSGAPAASEFDCCVAAMKFEASPTSKGGAPVRFQWRENSGEHIMLNDKIQCTGTGVFVCCDYPSDNPASQPTCPTNWPALADATDGLHTCDCWTTDGTATNDVREGTCEIDREKMLHGNLDSSGGRPVYLLGSCGAHTGHGTDTGHFYWRHAAGSADAANLNSGGQCVPNGRFTRVPDFDPTERGFGRPTGAIPQGHEVPNHACPDDTNTDPSGDIRGCSRLVRYNTITNVEDCCNACRTLKWMGSENSDTPMEGSNADKSADGSYVNPCVGFQIVNGQCHIMRREFFTQQYPTSSITEVVSWCAGYRGAPRMAPQDLHCCCK